jgi:hypothetical protein
MNQKERTAIHSMAVTRLQIEKWGACVALSKTLGRLALSGRSEDVRYNDLPEPARCPYPEFNLGDYLDGIAVLILALAEQVKENAATAQKAADASQHDLTKTQELVKTQAGYMRNYQEHIAFLESEAILRGATPAQLAADYKAMHEGGTAAGSPTDGGTAEPEPTPAEPDATPIDPDSFGGEDYFGRLR